jgi:hypothetical protein
MLGEIGEKGELITGLPGKAVGAVLASHALKVANSMQDIPMTQRRRILERLAHIGHARGIKAAVQSRKD